MKTAYFPSPHASAPITSTVIDVLDRHELEISSEFQNLSAPRVLSTISEDLLRSGFECAFVSDSGNKKSLEFPADDPTKTLVSKFDAFHSVSGTALVVLAGQGLINNTYLKSVVHASLAPKARHLILAVRITYRSSEDFEKIREFLEVLLGSENTHLDLDSLTLIGY